MIAPVDDSVRTFHKGLYTSDTFRYEDPTYLGFSLHFEFDPTHRDMETGLTHDALWAEPDQPGVESAMRYLQNIGLPNNAVALKKFKEMMRYMSKHAPYYFQGVTGVADLWKVNLSNKEFDSARSIDKKLVISCLESVDMRMAAMAELYRNATYDKRYMRDILPANLRYFTVVLRVAEMRNFHALRSALNAVDPTGFQQPRSVIDGIPDDLQVLSRMTSVVEFRLKKCTFDFEDSFGDEYSSSLQESEMATRQFSIDVGNISHSSSYELLDLVLSEFSTLDANGKNKDKTIVGGGGLRFGSQDGGQDPAVLRPILNSIAPGDRVSGWNGSSIDRFTGAQSALAGRVEQLGNTLEDLPSRLAARGLDSLSSRLTGATLGNVYRPLNRNLLENINQFLRSDDQIGPLGNAFE